MRNDHACLIMYVRACFAPVSCKSCLHWSPAIEGCAEALSPIQNIHSSTQNPKLIRNATNRDLPPQMAHCIASCRCPLLALSATIGNPQQFTGWLQDVKALQQQQDQQAGICKPVGSYTVQLVQHAERYADLRLHRYSHSVQENSGATGQLQKLHPCAVLSVEQLQDGMPDQITLEPADCLELFDHMAAAVQRCIDAQGREAFEARYAQQDLEQLESKLKAVLEGETPRLYKQGFCIWSHVDT